jgi:hypothetical protein
MQILFLTDTAITLAEDELNTKPVLDGPVNFPMRTDKIGVLEYVPSNFHRKVQEAEGLLRTGVWVSTLGSKTNLASQGRKLIMLRPLFEFDVMLVKTQLRLSIHTRMD